MSTPTLDQAISNSDLSRSDRKEIERFLKARDASQKIIQRLKAEFDNTILRYQQLHDPNTQTWTESFNKEYDRINERFQKIIEDADRDGFLPASGVQSEVLTDSLGDLDNLLGAFGLKMIKNIISQATAESSKFRESPPPSSRIGLIIAIIVVLIIVVGLIVFFTMTQAGKNIIAGSPERMVSEKAKEYFIDPMLLV